MVPFDRRSRLRPQRVDYAAVTAALALRIFDKVGNDVIVASAASLTPPPSPNRHAGVTCVCDVVVLDSYALDVSCENGRRSRVLHRHVENPRVCHRKVPVPFWKVGFIADAVAQLSEHDGTRTDV